MLEILKVIALLCTTSASGKGWDDYVYAADMQLKCQQRLIKCVNKDSIRNEISLMRCAEKRTLK